MGGSRRVKFELKFANLTSNLNIKNQGEVSQDGFKGFASLTVATASRSDVKI